MPKEKVETVDKPTHDDLDVNVEVHRTGNEKYFEEPDEDDMDLEDDDENE